MKEVVIVAARRTAVGSLVVRLLASLQVILAL